MTLRKKANSGRSLARKRRAVGLTQHDLCRRVGIEPTRLAFIETDRAIPTADELDRIRQALRQRLREVNREVRAAVCA